MTEFIVRESVRESQEGFISLDHLTDYDEEFKTYSNRFRARYCDILIDNSIEL